MVIALGIVGAASVLFSFYLVIFLLYRYIDRLTSEITETKQEYFALLTAFKQLEMPQPRPPEVLPEAFEMDNSNEFVG
jgi:hypothetical protein